jgi:xanthine dehydrogenase accessory factor
LIGSGTKRNQFRHRLLAKGYAATAIERISCPVGVFGIHDKSPETIAISVAAQLLQRVEENAAARRETACPTDTSTL